jgi:hypothetical protein
MRAFLLFIGALQKRGMGYISELGIARRSVSHRVIVADGKAEDVKCQITKKKTTKVLGM